jgi:GNAT superfamily N-acetyltransferase
VRRRWTTPAAALAAALPPPAEALPDGAALVPWAALTMADRQRLLRREDAGGPLGHPAAAAPFRHDARADLAHSLAVRHTPPTHTPPTPDAPAPVVAWLLLLPAPDAADARGAPGAHDDRPAWTAAPLFVAPGHRRRGLATALAATAARRLATTPHAAPHAALHWHAAPDADAAHAFATARLAGAATHTAGDYLAATRLR